MNNKQFIIMVAWISVATGIIGYQLGGILLGLAAFFGMAGLILGAGD